MITGLKMKNCLIQNKKNEKQESSNTTKADEKSTDLLISCTRK